MKLVRIIAAVVMLGIALDTCIDVYALTKPIHCVGTLNECPDC